MAINLKLCIAHGEADMDFNVSDSSVQEHMVVLIALQKLTQQITEQIAAIEFGMLTIDNVESLLEALEGMDIPPHVKLKMKREVEELMKRNGK